jgi:hypothetical protein
VTGSPGSYPANPLQGGYHAFRLTTGSLDQARYTWRFAVRGEVDPGRLEAAATCTLAEVQALSEWPDLLPRPDPPHLGGRPAGCTVRAVAGGADLDLTIHHLAADGAALDALCRQISRRYLDPAPPPATPTVTTGPLGAALAGLAGERADADYAYWSRVWADLDSMPSPPTRPRPGTVDYRISSAPVDPVSMRRSARARRTTLTGLLIGACTDAAAHVLSAPLRTVVVPIDLRPHLSLPEDDAHLIGFAVNSLVLPTAPLRDGDRLREVAAALLDHGLTPMPILTGRYTREHARIAPTASWLVQIVAEPPPSLQLPGSRSATALDGSASHGRDGLVTLVVGERPRVDLALAGASPGTAQRLAATLAELLEGADRPSTTPAGGPTPRSTAGRPEPVTGGPAGAAADTAGSAADTAGSAADTAGSAADTGQHAAGVASAVQDVWREVLGLVAVPPDAHFLTLGGTSVAAVTLSHRLATRYGIDLPPDVVLTRPRLADHIRLARRLRSEAGDGPATAARTATPVVMPSVMYRYMKHHHDGVFNTEYNLGYSWRISGPVDAGALAAAAGACIRRHEALQLRYVRDADAWKVYGAPVDEALEITRLGADTYDDDTAVHALLEEERVRPFAPRHPLIRIKLWSDPPGQRHLLNITVPHLIFDGWSKNVLLADLAAFYTDGPGAPRPPVHGWSAYREHLLTRVDAGLDAFTYWNRQLRGTRPLLDLPDRTRAEVQRGLPSATLAIDLDRDRFERRRRALAAAGTTPELATITAVIAALARVFGSDDVLIGLPAANRDDARWAHTIALMSLYLPIRYRITDRPVDAASVRRLVRDAQAHRLPFETVKAVTDSPVPTDCAVTIATPATPFQLPGARAAPVAAPTRTAHRPMDVILDIAGDTPTLLLGYLVDHVPAGSARRLLDQVAGELT